MEFTDTSTIYRPLRKTEMRVVQFKPYSTVLGNDKIEGKLRHIHLNSSPDFYALSYVWGDPTVTSTISIDGKDLDLLLS